MAADFSVYAMLKQWVQKSRQRLERTSNLMWLTICYPCAFLTAYSVGDIAYKYWGMSDHTLISMFDNISLLKSALMVLHAKFGQSEAGRTALTFALFGIVAVFGGVLATFAAASEKTKFIRRQPDVKWISIPIALIVVVGLIFFSGKDSITGECYGRSGCLWQMWPLQLSFFLAPFFFGPYFAVIYLRFCKKRWCD